MPRGPFGGTALRRDEIDPACIPRFEAKLRKSGKCQLWTGSKSAGMPRSPQGIFQVVLLSGERRLIAARRVAYALAFGEAPARAATGVTCGHSLCLAPEHLISGTSANPVHEQKVIELRRRVAEGADPQTAAKDLGVLWEAARRALVGQTFPGAGGAIPDLPYQTCRGEKAPPHKLTAAIITKARQDHAKGVSALSLANRYGVVCSTMWDAIHGVTWKHLDTPPCREQHRERAW